MKPTIQNVQEYLRIIWGENKDWELVQKDEEGGKHDCTEETYLMQYKPNGLYYLLWNSQSYNDGAQIEYTHDFPNEPEEIELIPVTTYKYKIK